MIFIYLLKLVFHQVTMVGRLVQREEIDSTRRRNDKQNSTKTIQNIEYTKYKTKIQNENKYKKNI